MIPALQHSYLRPLFPGISSQTSFTLDCPQFNRNVGYVLGQHFDRVQIIHENEEGKLELNVRWQILFERIEMVDESDFPRRDLLYTE